MEQNVVVNPLELMKEIVAEIGHYDEIIKTGKEFSEAKRIRQDVRDKVKLLKEFLKQNHNCQ